MRVANERRRRQLLRSTRDREQLQAGLVRQAVSFFLIYFLGRNVVDCSSSTVHV